MDIVWLTCVEKVKKKERKKVSVIINEIKNERKRKERTIIGKIERRYATKEKVPSIPFLYYSLSLSSFLFLFS